MMLHTLIFIVLTSTLPPAMSGAGLRVDARDSVKLADRSTEVPVSVQMRPAQAGVRQDDYWGTGPSGGRLVTRLSLVVARERVFIPRSAYADLANVNTVSIASYQDTIAVNMVGGSGGLLYYVKYLFSSGRLRLRNVTSPSHPTEEVTFYTWP